jgi:serine/threonine-protein kinase
VVATSVSPDGRFVIIAPGMGAQSLTIDTTDPDHPKAGPTEPLLNTSAMPGGTISPDGRWLAYTSLTAGDTPSGASGTPQVFVRPFANGKIAGSGVSQISAAGGAYPVWSRAAHQHQRLYATSEGRIMVVDYSAEGDSFNVLKSRPWTDKQILTIPGNAPRGTLDLRQGPNGIIRPFDLTPDGRRIIAWEPQEEPKEAKVDLHVTMLLNWFDELRRRLPPSGK